MKKVALPDNARETAQALLSSASQSQDRLQMYIGGCKDTLELSGDWNLDTKTWTFVKMPKKGGK